MASTYNWRRFLLLLSAKVISEFNSLTRSERIKAFVIDDYLIERSRSKEVELLANTYDHVFRRFVRGFTLLALGWTDGYSFVPVDFAMLSSVLGLCIFINIDSGYLLDILQNHLNLRRELSIIEI